VSRLLSDSLTEINERVITPIEAGLTAGLFEKYLTLGHNVDLAGVSIHQPHMMAGAIRVSRVSTAIVSGPHTTQ
jgi:hypothetical protein